jgi:threonylcarbamoyladenosine tRNA methylthiotransferase MtaB
VLTGIHLGAYGHDLSPALNLSDAMRRIDDSKPIDRIRLSSIEPFEFTQSILEQAANSEIFCRHFHIPLQSGDATILKKMGRPYTPKVFADLIHKIRQLLPDAAIGVDALIGFPGEDHTAFENTYHLLENLPITYLHVFPFSPRPGTKAAGLSGKIDRQVIKDRCEQMRVLGHKKREEFYRKFIGRELPLLIESKRDPLTNLLKGISSNYLPVLIETGDEFINQIIDVKIQNLEGLRLFGKKNA